MNKLILTTVIIFLIVSVSYGQLTDSVFMSQMNTNNGNKDITINLKTNFLYAFSDGNNTTSAYGLIGEVQENLTDRTSLLLTINPTFWKGSDNTKRTALLISVGPKFYFEKKETTFRGYFSICVGLIVGGKNIGTFFSILPALGFEYKITKSIGVSIESKPILSLVPIISFGVGLTINLN